VGAVHSIKLRRTQYEHMFSASPSAPDIARRRRHFAFVPRTDVSGTELSAGSPSFESQRVCGPESKEYTSRNCVHALCRPDVIFINWISDGRQGMHTAFMEVGRLCAIDGQTEKFRSTVVAARVHQLLASIDCKRSSAALLIGS
jgi:hypothetical protein